MVKIRTYLLISLALIGHLISNPILSQCVADFRAVLDSNSTQPYRYKFYDQSSGNPNSWYWIFGDGSASTEQNPVHTYQSEGNYTVCLEIADISNPFCSDTICKALAMPEYHNLGGFAFTGEVPINNPFNTGDTGIAYMYRKISGNRIAPIDTIRFDTLGYYWFSNLLAAEYIIKVELTHASNHYKDFLPTYHPDKTTWQNANTIAIKDNNLFEVHTYLRFLPGTEEGPGKLRGKVTLDVNPLSENQLPLYPVEVILMDENKEPLAFTHTNLSGYFSFRQLRFGTYWLYPECAGMYAAPRKVVINENNPTVDTINLIIYEQNITSTPELPSEKGFDISEVYPNPVKNNARLYIKLYSQQEIHFRIFDICGKLVDAKKERLNRGDHVIILPVEDLASGLYLLTVRSGDGMISLKRKFIK